MLSHPNFLISLINLRWDLWSVMNWVLIRKHYTCDSVEVLLGTKLCMLSGAQMKLIAISLSFLNFQADLLLPLHFSCHIKTLFQKALECLTSKHQSQSKAGFSAHLYYFFFADHGK